MDLEETYVFRCDAHDMNFEGARSFKWHLRNVNHVAPYKCGQEECENTFMHTTSLMRHIRCSHIRRRAVLAGQGQAAGIDIAGPRAVNDVVMQAGENLTEGEAGSHMDPEGSGGAASDEDTETVDLIKSAASMTLNLRQSGGLTNTSIQHFQEECFKLVKNVAACSKEKVRKFFSEEGIDTPAARNLLSELDVDNPFQGINTLKKQLNYFADQMGLVKPQTNFLDYRIDYHLNPLTVQYEPKQVPMSFQYIPIIETLMLVLSNPRMKELIEAEKASEDGVLRSYLDGSRAKENLLVAQHPSILRLQLYWDDVEVVNPLGSKTSIHKLAALYFSIQNIPAVERSQLSSIYLLALAYAEDLKTVPGGFKKILTPFLSDLKKLESANGVTYWNEEDEIVCLRATLTTLCADTLAAHEILGFLGPSATYFCRTCMVSRQEFHGDCCVVGQRRTRELFDAHVQMVGQHSSFSRQCGVKSDCVLHESAGFNATDDAIFDIFHDLLEGVCHWVILLTLNSFVNRSKYFGVEDFNGRISAFNYSIPDIKNKPSPNLTTKSLNGDKLKQTGSQAWCLARVFGFLVPEVPEGSLELLLMNLLQEIMLIVFSEEVRPEDIAKLENLIQEHHRLFQQLYTNAADSAQEDESESDVEEPPNPRVQHVKRVKPRNKLHHMLHCPEYMRKFGPLLHYWCARYEARHHIFCKYGAICSNFINLPKTMAQMHQMSTLAGALKTTFRADEVDVHSPQETIVGRCDHINLLISLGLAATDIVTTGKSVMISGEDHRPGLFVVTDTTIPTFALIQQFYLFRNQVYFILLPWQTEDFIRRFCAYRVKPLINGEAFARSHKSLPKHGALALWNPWKERSMYISPRTILF